MTAGKLGEFFSALMFAGAFIASISFFLAEKNKDGSKRGFEKLATIGFFSNVIGVFGVIITLFVLIYSHNYYYHYPWSHSSNELPVYYMISCFWEGQEGSFLLWMFWNCVLGTVVFFTTGTWRNIVLSVLCSVNLILGSMILGISIDETTASILISLSALTPAIYLFIKALNAKENGNSFPLFHLAAFTLAILSVAIIFTGNGGFFSLKNLLSNTSQINTLAYALLTLAWFACLGLWIYLLIKKLTQESHADGGWELLAGMIVLGITLTVFLLETGDWKIGSTPLLTLKQANPGDPIWLKDPSFIPTNGSGLNPALQNYWMVIHPPTLFLGFASTTIPFSFVVGALLRGKYTDWIKPALPWMNFSGMVLGLGIIMGGYWAYETLNFGGYWNWDPVENSSFVPWLGIIAGIHSIHVFRKSGSMLIPGMLLTCAAFILVLYSTFLTRSGILGETSVHSFTDLGLSGQLLLLFLFYTGAFILLLLFRAALIPKGHKEMTLKSAEFFLFLGVLTLVFASLGITLATSIPVINAIFGTDWSAPASAPYFFYKWNVWFAIGISLFSGIAQFLFWNKIGKHGIKASLLRPLVIAFVLCAGCILYFAYNGQDFVYDAKYHSWIEAAKTAGFGSKISYYISWLFMNFADEIYLIAALFFLFSSLDIFIFLMRKNQKTRRVSGGSLAHTGFALMLCGFLFSSGHQRVVSINSHPEELPEFPSEEQKDNIVLPKGVPSYDIAGYEVTYLGRIKPLPPIRDVSIIEDFGAGIMVKFTDSGDDYWSVDLPKDVFLDEAGTKVDMGEVQFFIEDRMTAIPNIKRLNKRDRFQVQFSPIEMVNGAPLVNTSKSFIKIPETEFNPGNKESISHPARKIFLSKDIYLFVSNKPEEKDLNKESRFRDHLWKFHKGDTARLPYGIVRYKDLFSVDTAHTRFSLIASVDLEILDQNGMVYHSKPLYRVDKKNQISLKEDFLEAHNTYFIFSGIDPETGEITVIAREEIDPPHDYIVIKALEKPWINVLWLGTLVMLTGFFISWRRRRLDNRSSTNAH